MRFRKFKPKITSSLFIKTKKKSSIVPRYARYFKILIFEWFFIIFFVIVEYIAQRKGVIRASTYPIKRGETGARVAKSPPVTKRNPPIDAIKNPTILRMLNFSLKNIKANIVITNGANRHTNKAGREGPNKSIAVYWAKKKNETPVKLAQINKIQSCFENFWLFSLFSLIFDSS